MEIRHRGAEGQRGDRRGSEGQPTPLYRVSWSTDSGCLKNASRTNGSLNIRKTMQTGSDNNNFFSRAYNIIFSEETCGILRLVGGL